MSIELYIKETVTGLCDKVYISPNIPGKKLDGAVSGMTDGIDPDYVLAIADSTVFGGAKEGCLFTGTNLYIHAFSRDKINISLADLSNVHYSIEEKKDDKGKVKRIEHLILDYYYGSKIDLTDELQGINIKHLSNILTEIIKRGESEEFTASSQTTPLSLMNEIIKLSYLKLICNFAFNDSGKIDGKVYSEIISLAVRIELNSNSRLNIRNYITDSKNCENNDILLKIISDNISQDSFNMVKKSLIKDILNLYRTEHNNSNWRNSNYIVNIAESLAVEEEQVDIIENAIIHEEDILLLRKNDSEIEKSMKDLVAKAGAVGVPLAAVYLSGSVIGVSAAGMTSGLAALGLGGVLGFSSMFTGIGVAVLIGVGTYKGIKKVTGIGDLENNKQRELMLQEIIKNSQKSLNYLIEDVNAISNSLTEEIKKGIENQEKIGELSNMLVMLSSGATNISGRINYAEKEKLITKLPKRLDLSRLNELTNTPTRKKYKEVVMNCYQEELVEQKDGSNKPEFILNDGLSIEELNNLYNIFEEIGYNKLADATVASVKGLGRSALSNILGNE